MSKSRRIIHIDMRKIADEITEPVLLAVAEQGATQAALLAPIDNGQLSDSIISEMIDKDTAYYGTNVEYAPYIEFGTGIYAEGGSGAKKIPWTYFSDKLQRFVTTYGHVAQPFLRFSADIMRKKAGRIAAKALKGVLKKHGK